MCEALDDYDYPVFVLPDHTAPRIIIQCNGSTMRPVQADTGSPVTHGYTQQGLDTWVYLCWTDQEGWLSSAFPST
jgi:hypothetical protein